MTREFGVSEMDDAAGVAPKGTERSTAPANSTASRALHADASSNNYTTYSTLLHRSRNDKHSRVMETLRRLAQEVMDPSFSGQKHVVSVVAFTIMQQAMARPDAVGVF
jgi:hypothetical protein